MTRRLYTLEPRDRTGVFLGLSITECALIGGGFLAAIMARLAGFPAVMAAVPLAGGAGLAKVRVGGRPLREWIPLLAGWAATRLSGRRSWHAPLPLFPGTEAAELPPVLRDIDVREVPSGGGRTMAAVCDRRTGRLTAVLVVGGAQFACQDTGAQDALIASWGDVLGGTAATGSPVVQIGWSDAATMSGLAEHRRWAADRLTEVDGTIGDPASYQDLLAEMTGLATAHETVVWITVAGAQVRDGHGKPLERAAGQLPAAVDNLAAALTAAGLHTTGPVPAVGLWRLLRARIDPDDEIARPTPAGGSLAERLGLVDATNAGPVAISTGWSQMRIDGSFHRTYWIESWPRRPVGGDWLVGFLAAGESRTMTVLHRPLDPERSQRRIESQMVKLTANRVRKQDKDRRVTETDLRTEQAVHDLESELASGFAEVLYLGLVTVSARGVEDLDAAGRRLEQAARARGMGLRVLHGRQDVAWAASLPFGLAEPGLLEVVGV